MTSSKNTRIALLRAGALGAPFAADFALAGPDVATTSHVAVRVITLDPDTYIALK